MSSRGFFQKISLGALPVSWESPKKLVTFTAMDAGWKLRPLLPRSPTPDLENGELLLKKFQIWTFPLARPSSAFGLCFPTVNE